MCHYATGSRDAIMNIRLILQQSPLAALPLAVRGKHSEKSRNETMPFSIDFADL